MSFVMGQMVKILQQFDEVDRTFPLEQASQAHKALDEHPLGKIALRVG